MKWLRVLVIVLDLYLLTSLGPWIALQILNWLLQKSGHYLASEDKRLRELEEAMGSQSSIWPQPPRPGRYRQPDEIAQENLRTLHTAIDKARKMWPRLASYRVEPLALTNVLLWQAWGPLGRVVAVWRDVRGLNRLLDAGDDLLSSLQKQERVIQNIPSRMQASLNGTRAEIRRVSALLEAEEEAGTLGLQDITRRLERSGADLEKALDKLAQTSGERMPLLIYEADDVLERVLPEIEDIDRFLAEAASARAKTQSVTVRVNSSLRLAQERWQSLKARGATETFMRRELATLEDKASGLMQMAKRRTLDTYQRVPDQVSEFDAQFNSFVEKLDRLSNLMNESREIIKGDVRALAQVQASCDELCDKDPRLDPDQSLALVEKATEAYVRAERERGLGTIESYKSSIALSTKAKGYLEQASEGAASLLNRAGRVRELLGNLSSENVGEWHDRIHRLREQLQVYALHWDKTLAGDVGEAISNLEQVEVNLERVPPDVRYGRSLRQSELPEALEILSHAQECMNKAKELISSLEQEQQRIETLRENLENEIETVRTEAWPAIEEKKQYMLPELRERLQESYQAFLQQLAILKDPAQVNYDEALGRWLPSMLSQLKEIRSAHAGDIDHYQATVREAQRSLDHVWGRLNKLSPYEQPMPEEDIDKLATDLEEWHAEAEQEMDNPVALRALVGRRAMALEQRMETAQQQIRDGRSNLDKLDRQYRGLVKSVHRLRSAIREIQQESRWPQIAWGSDQAEQIWKQAIELERESQAALTLTKANNQIQQAVNTAQEAEEIFARTEKQMSNALRRLDDELRAADAHLERGKDQVDLLKEEGLTEESTATTELCARAARTVQMALSSSTFEDALRHLRDAKNMLTQL